jgi:hypothetical protein
LGASSSHLDGSDWDGGKKGVELRKKKKEARWPLQVLAFSPEKAAMNLINPKRLTRRLFLPNHHHLGTLPSTYLAVGFNRLSIKPNTQRHAFSIIFEG